MLANLRINRIKQEQARWRKVAAMGAALCFFVFAGSYPAWAIDKRAPEVPVDLKVQDGNKVHFHVYAAGFQIYKWSAATSAWVFQAPEAVLFDSDGNVVGIHYAGRKWESNSGSKVVGKRLKGVMVDPDAIPWLLLEATSSNGPGVLNRTTYIQRVSTVGGLAPAAPGVTDGEEADVPYLAEYFFYRAED